jgi:hypothetical protein
MKDTLTFLLAASFAFLPGTTVQSAPHPEKAQMVHFVVINMSGSLRELRHRGDIVPLPVAMRVPVQVPVGDKVLIASSTNRKVEMTIAIEEKDEGRTIPVR